MLSWLRKRNSADSSFQGRFTPSVHWHRSLSKFKHYWLSQKMIWEVGWNRTFWVPGCHDQTIAKAKQGWLYARVKKVNSVIYLLEEEQNLYSRYYNTQTYIYTSYMILSTILYTIQKRIHNVCTVMPFTFHLVTEQAE